MNINAILAFDPGGTTGWASYWNGRVDAGQDTDPMNFIARADAWLHAAANSSMHAIVVGERYVITHQTAKKSQQTTALEIIGAMRYIAHTHSVKFSLQNASEAKKFATDERLKRLEMYCKGADHANDASRHLVTALVTNGWRDSRL